MSNSGSFTMTYAWVAERKKWDEATREGLVRNFFKPNIRVSVAADIWGRDTMRIVLSSRRQKTRFTCENPERPTRYPCPCIWCEQDKADDGITFKELRLPIEGDSQP